VRRVRLALVVPRVLVVPVQELRARRLVAQARQAPQAQARQAHPASAAH
jgi:hypothetical protein